MMSATPNLPDIRLERLLRLLAAATFVIFFQAFMVAPILPQLGAALGPRRRGSA